MKCTLLVIVFSACFAFASTANTRNPGNTDLTEVTLETNAKVNDQRISTEVDISDSNLNSQQQKINVTGKIVDATGEPIIGATIVEYGVPTNGTISDVDGNFSISVGQNAALEISYIGYISQ